MRCPFGLTARLPLAGLAALAACASSACSPSSSPPATGTAAFVGVWMPVGQDAGTSVASRTCGNQKPATSPLTSNLTVTADGANLISASTSDGCMVILMATGNTAAALEDQMCTIYATAGGAVAVETVVSYTLAVDGTTLTSAATGTTTEGKPKPADGGIIDTNCTISSEGEYIKQ